MKDPKKEVAPGEASEVSRDLTSLSQLTLEKVESLSPTEVTHDITHEAGNDVSREVGNDVSHEVGNDEAQDNVHDGAHDMAQSEPYDLASQGAEAEVEANTGLFVTAKASQSSHSIPDTIEIGPDAELVTLWISNPNAESLEDTALRKILELNEKAKLGLDSHLLRSQAESGRVLLSSISRYSAVWLMQKLASHNVEIHIKEAGAIENPNTENNGLSSFSLQANSQDWNKQRNSIQPSSVSNIPVLKEIEGMDSSKLRPLHVESLVEIMDHLQLDSQKDYQNLYQKLEAELLARVQFHQPVGRTQIKSKLELIRPPFLYRLSLTCIAILPSP